MGVYFPRLVSKFIKITVEIGVIGAISNFFCQTRSLWRLGQLLHAESKIALHY